jgi:hypothetical protein
MPVIFKALGKNVRTETKHRNLRVVSKQHLNQFKQVFLKSAKLSAVRQNKKDPFGAGRCRQKTALMRLLGHKFFSAKVVVLAAALMDANQPAIEATPT